MKNINSEVIIILCSYLCVGEDVKPFETTEWSRIAEILIENQLTPKDLVDMKKEELLVLEIVMKLMKHLPKL